MAMTPALLTKNLGTWTSKKFSCASGKCLGTRREARIGRPDPIFISTSFVEKHNQTMRQNMRRDTRLTAGHSKKVVNNAAATALHFMHYNFARPCRTILCTPAMEAGLSDHVWTVEELVVLAN